MTKLIIVRHGQSEANLKRIFAGHSNFDLTDIGRLQAERICTYITENFKLDAIYSSDLLRAYNTVLPTARALGMEVIPHTGLREIYAGAWESLTTAELEEKFAEDFSLWRNDYASSRCTDGESTKEVYDRAWRVIRKIAGENDGKTLLIGTHAAVVRGFSTQAYGLPPIGMNEIPFYHNASINLFDYEDGRVTPVKTDITEHLGDVITGVHYSFNKPKS